MLLRLMVRFLCLFSSIANCNRCILSVCGGFEGGLFSLYSSLCCDDAVKQHVHINQRLLIHFLCDRDTSIVGL